MNNIRYNFNVKKKFAIVPRKCEKCGTSIWIQKYTNIKTKIENGIYCTECAKRIFK